MMDTDRSDEQIVLDVLAGQINGFAIIVRRYEGRLQRYGRRFLVSREHIEDIVQEVFIKVYQNLRSFSPHRRFSPWIYRIAHNAFVNALRDTKRDPLPFFDPEVLFPHPIAKERADTETERHEIRAMLDRCLDKLEAKYREPLVLFYFEDLDYRAIADILHLPLSTVGVRISRGRKKLKVILSYEHD